MIIYPEGYKTQSRIHVLFLIIMYSRKLYLEDKNSSKQATTKSTTYKEVDHTYGARLYSKGGVDFFLWWWNTFTNQIRISKTSWPSTRWPESDLFPQGRWWDLQEKNLLEIQGKPEEKLKKKERERGCATLALPRARCEFQCGIVHGCPSLPPLIFIA